jgi:hypothetical protein
VATPDELGAILGEALYSPPVLAMRVVVPRPLGDDTEACSRATSALLDDLRDAVTARGLRPSGGITLTMWAVALTRAQVEQAAAQAEEAVEWMQVQRQESWADGLPDWADARMFEAIVHVD